MRIDRFALTLLVLAALCLGRGCAGQDRRLAANAPQPQSYSMQLQLSSVASRFHDLILALRGWLAAIFSSVGEVMSWGSGSGEIPAATSNSASYPSSALEWSGVRASTKELDAVAFVRESLLSEIASGKLKASTWLSSASDREFLRFVRHHNGNKDSAWKSIKAHATWRTSPYGCETIVKEGRGRFAKSPLNKEIFWLGVSKQGCPTLVVRTRAHDGADYNEDPKTFARLVRSFVRSLPFYFFTFG